jgi:hypothetical protein
VVEGRVDTELVVGAAIPEVKSRRYGEISLESNRQLIEQTLPGRRGMSNQETSLRWIVDSVGSVDKLSHL